MVSLTGLKMKRFQLQEIMAENINITFQINLQYTKIIEKEFKQQKMRDALDAIVVLAIIIGLCFCFHIHNENKRKKQVYEKIENNITEVYFNEDSLKELIVSEGNLSAYLMLRSKANVHQKRCDFMDLLPYSIYMANKYHYAESTIWNRRRDIYNKTKKYMKEYISDKEKQKILNDKRFKVYLLTFPNNKVYVGITSQEEKNRWKDGNGYIDNKIMFNDEVGLIIELGNGNYVPASKLSIGTIDQLYLSLRLSMAEELSNEKLPIILDEAFAYYDEERLENILHLSHQ